MIKKGYLILVVILTSFNVFAQVNFFPTNFHLKWPYYSYDKINQKDVSHTFSGVNAKYLDGQVFPILVTNKKGIYISFNGGKKYEFISENTIQKNNFGFEEILFDNKQQIMIRGGNYYAFRPVAEESRDNKAAYAIHKLYYDKDFDGTIYDYSGNDQIKKEMCFLAQNYILDFGGSVGDGIHSVIMNVPFLTETINNKKIIYDTEFLKYRWCFTREDRVNYKVSYANCTKPMVEGDPGNGTGVVLDIDFVLPSDNLVVLNGYVDWNKQHLYKKNARMKKVLVEGDDFSFEYTFEDYVHFAQIDFPKKVDKIKLTVKEVYDGEKWSDMAISGLWVNLDVTKTANSKIAEEYLQYAEEHCKEITD